MRVKAIQKMYYNRRDILPGETYEMDDREASEANILSLLGKIQIIKEEKTKALQPEQPKFDEPPEQPIDEPPKPESMSTETENAEVLTPTRRTYRRRDLKAEQ